MRQRLKSRMNPRGRPHLKQRRTTRLLNLGLRCAFTIIDVFAIDMGVYLGGMESRAPCFSAWVIEPSGTAFFPQYPILRADLLDVGLLRGAGTIRESLCEVNKNVLPSIRLPCQSERGSYNQITTAVIPIPKQATPAISDPDRTDLIYDAGTFRSRSSRTMGNMA